MLKVNSYADINGLRFGSNETEIIAYFGQPIERSISRESEPELHFPSFILRFDACSCELREITLLAGCNGIINGVDLAWDDGFLNWLVSEDHSLMEGMGYILSFKLGIAVTGFHDGDGSQKAIHIFREGDWDLLRIRMHPFTKQT